MQLLLQILGHFPPRIPLARPNAKDPAYEELVIPERLKDFKVDLGAVSGLLKPFLKAPPSSYRFEEEGGVLSPYPRNGLLYQPGIGSRHGKGTGLHTVHRA